MKIKITGIALLLSLIVFCMSVLYYNYFSSALLSDLWQNINGFTRIVIPDTFIYKNIVDPSDFTQSIIISGVKNTIGPSFIWMAANENWVLVSLINSLLLFLALRYQIKIASVFCISMRRVVIITFVLSLIPATIYYSVGSLKEIATMTFLLGFYYHYIKGQYIKWISCAIIVVLFRYQMIGIVFLFLFCDQFKKRALLAAFIILFFISATYPYIANLVVFSADAANIYREGQEGTTGAYVEFVRANIPIFSMLAVIIRVIQSIFEPLLSLISEPSFYEDGDLSVISVVNVISFAAMFIFWICYFKKIIFSFSNPFSLRKDVMRLYMLSMLYVVPVGGFSFIHHRYLYPITAIVLLISVVDKTRILPTNWRMGAATNQIGPELKSL